ncbi:hypothetical protein [Priestia taiwanensis]|uniref:Uncharacterized protein n=1 Tax=Priestia taiwanensis TaxID=1347902 RepID=A0A917EMN9_9BACI|nr:hypothetical protein [Priestia taiwanensis]MBM7362282.1 hypothetical protein [Priestia taiwanensis]GGE60956.1 hypothetical protein GCM10007140_09040 [Priestia taiwanensis]
MKVSKIALALSKVVISFVLVYGMAFVMNVWKGTYLFANGILDQGYAFLFLAISIPLVMYILSMNKKHMKQAVIVSISSIIFILILYKLVYMTSISELKTGEFLHTDKMTRMALIFLCTSFLFVGTSHIAAKMK